MVFYGFGSTELSVWKYVYYWNMGAPYYAFVAGATSRDPYSTILIGIGSYVLRFCGGSHLQNPNSIKAWELRATP